MTLLRWLRFLSWALVDLGAPAWTDAIWNLHRMWRTCSFGQGLPGGLGVVCNFGGVWMWFALVCFCWGFCEGLGVNNGSVLEVSAFLACGGIEDLLAFCCIGWLLLLHVYSRVAFKLVWCPPVLSSAAWVSLRLTKQWWMGAHVWFNKVVSRVAAQK